MMVLISAVDPVNGDPDIVPDPGFRRPKIVKLVQLGKFLFLPKKCTLFIPWPP